MTLQTWLALFLVLVILVGIALGRYPWLRMNRATIALVGATLLVLIGAIGLEEAYAAIDMNTIVLLFAMMIINVNLRLAGFFRLVNRRVAQWAHSPRGLLALIVAAAGILSALFLNDTIVLMFTPLVLEMTAARQRNPIPYLIGLATAANIGSVATITGNPQNMLIGMSSGIPYVTFTAYLAPVAVVGLVLAWGVVALVYRGEFTAVHLPPPNLPPDRPYRPLLRKSLVATGLMLVAFVAGVPVPLAALAAAGLLLITRRLKPERVFREIDWTLLVFFAALFVVTGAIVTSGLSDRLFAVLQPVAERGIVPLTAVSVILSNTISNVPAVMLFRPFVAEFSDPQTTWLVLAMATTLAGNLTLLGSVANLIVAETAATMGVRLTFGEYLKAGVPITVLSLTWGVAWLALVT
ncbi:MAG TPA: anion transporter [Chloroflexota bacterium]|nr:anion transporter [Chloroflexota bacterium]